MTRRATFRTGTSIAALLVGVAFAGTAAAADGCPGGTFSVGHAPDGLSHAVFFSAFLVDAATPTATCVTEIAPATAGYALYSAQYRGFAILEDGDTVTFTAPDGTPPGTGATGPYDAPVDLDQVIATGPGEALILNFTIDLTAGVASTSVAGLDTADFARIGFTTFSSVEASMNAIAHGVVAAMNQLRGTADYLLLGGIGPFDAPDGIATVAAAGSALFGVTGRLTPTEGLTILGGAALLAQTAGTIDIGFSPLVAGAVRYVLPGTTASRFFLEAGLTAAPRLGLTIARPYENNGAMTAGIGTADGRLVTLFGRAGTSLDLGAVGDLVLATTLAHNVLHVGAYAETMSPSNPFPASFAAARYASTTVAAGIAFTTPVTPTLDMTLAADVGRNFGTLPVDGDVAFIGPVSGTAAPGLFASASARFGFHPTARLSAEAFVLGMKSAGTEAEVQIGGALRFTF